MAALRLMLDGRVRARIPLLGDRDRGIVAENLAAIQEDPQKAGHPSFLRRAAPGAWQHTCPHSFVVLYRWDTAPGHPADAVTIEDLVERL